MTKLSTLLAATASVLVLAGAAVAADETSVKAESTIDHSKNGGYDKTTTAEKSTPSGTVADKTETKLKVADDGDTTKTTTTKHTNDPKGLMNKHTDKTETTEKTKDGQTTVKKTHKVDGKTVSDDSANTTVTK